jgi:hypothetical protein
MLLALGFCNNRAAAAAWQYELHCSGRRHPGINAFRRLDLRLRDGRSVTPAVLVKVVSHGLYVQQAMKMP